jgi:hypothetical protein
VGGLLSYTDTFRVTETLNTSGFWEYKGIGYLEPRPPVVAPFILVSKNSFVVQRDDFEMVCVEDRQEVAQTTGACAYKDSYLYISSPSGDDLRADPVRYQVSYAINLHAYGIVALLLVALLLALLACARSQAAVTRIGGAALVFVGLSLLVANVVGLTQSLRHPDVQSAPGNFFPIDVTINHDTALELLQLKDDDDIADYVTRATLAVANSVLHEWNDEHFKKFRVHIPIWENWILHFLGLIRPELRDYIFWDHRRGLERGVGLCGHVSSILVGFLREQGLDARTVALSGHMVVTVQVEDGSWHLLDPDYGVVIPHSLEQVIEDPDILERAYSERLMYTALSAQERTAIMGRILDYYGHTESNMVDGTGRLGYYSGMAFPAEWYAQRERLTYALIWPIPLAMLGAGAVLFAIGRGKKVHGLF